TLRADSKERVTKTRTDGRPHDHPSVQLAAIQKVGVLFFLALVESDLRRSDTAQHRRDVLRRLDLGGRGASCGTGRAGRGGFTSRRSSASRGLLFGFRFPRCFFGAFFGALRTLSLRGPLCHFARRLLRRLLRSLSFGSHRALLLGLP